MLTALQRYLKELKIEACALCLQPSPAQQLCSHCVQQLLVATKRCPRCALALTPDALQCPDCARRQTYFDKTVAAFDYTPPTDQLIHLLKHQKQFSLAPAIANLIAIQIQQHLDIDEHAWYITAIPSSPQSRIKRGFNPAGEIAKQLAKQLKLPYQDTVLQRRGGHFFKQAHLNRLERQQHSTNLFYCHQSPSHLIIVDDILTTGTTLNQASLSCRQAGAQTIITAVAARGCYPRWEKYYPNAYLFSPNN